jgi:hypothetical protein
MNLILIAMNTVKFIRDADLDDYEFSKCAGIEVDMNSVPREGDTVHIEGMDDSCTTVAGVIYDIEFKDGLYATKIYVTLE